MFAGFESVNGNRGVHVIGNADADRFDFGVGKQLVVIVIRFGDFVTFRFFFEFIRQNIAQSNDFRIFHFGVGIRMDGPDGTAADDADLDFFAHN